MNAATTLAILNAILSLAERIPSLVEALNQSKELTPEQEKELDDRIANLPNLDHWRG